MVPATEATGLLSAEASSFLNPKTKFSGIAVGAELALSGLVLSGVEVVEWVGVGLALSVVEGVGVGVFVGVAVGELVGVGVAVASGVGVGQGSRGVSLFETFLLEVENLSIVWFASGYLPTDSPSSGAHTPPSKP